MQNEYCIRIFIVLLVHDTYLVYLSHLGDLLALQKQYIKILN